MYKPSMQEYLELSENYKVIPVYKELFADLETPISIFKKLNCQGDCYLLESVEGGNQMARYSFIGFKNLASYENRDGVAQVIIGEQKISYQVSPVEGLESLMGDFRAPIIEELPPFYGGAVGYFGYDTIGYYENLKSNKANDLDLPEAAFLITKFVLIYDHLKHRLLLVNNTLNPERDTEQYFKAQQELEQVEEMLKGVYPPDRCEEEENRGAIELTSNVTKEEFMNRVEKAKDYISQGDIFQVVLSQRFSLPLHKPPFEVYRQLRRTNPSPYLYYLQISGKVIIGSSPEALVKVKEGMVETHPIAGTRPRGNTLEQDLLLAEELLADEKENAEHLMLVDLGRNDLGKVSKAGTVQLETFRKIERYSHVMHIVSKVTGQLREDMSQFDALKACFPAGTVSGAPKIRAMEIIEELEPTRRGLYAGAIGYFSFTGNLDTCIAIRTLLITQARVYLQAGAGIVADSIPELEYEETINKAKALLKILDIKEVTTCC